MTPEESANIRRRLEEVELISKDNNRILNQLALTTEKLTINIQHLQENKEEIDRLNKRVSESENWITANKKSVEGLDALKEKVTALREEVIQNRPILKALLVISSALATSAVGLVIAYLFSGKAS